MESKLIMARKLKQKRRRSLQRQKGYQIVHCVLLDIMQTPRESIKNEMDADYVTGWSKGGATDIKNCQMLC